LSASKLFWLVDWVDKSQEHKTIKNNIDKVFMIKNLVT